MNACIIYLASKDHADSLKLSLATLVKNHPPYPIFIFHEADFPHSIRRMLTVAYPVEFIEIKFTMPDYSPDLAAKIPDVFRIPGCAFGLGYRHMCRFFSGEVFKQPAIRSFKYAMRIDADSFILEPIGNVFKALHQAKAVYGYRVAQAEHPDCYGGFYEAFAQGVRKAGYEPIDIPVGGSYYNNFEVLDLDYFRSPTHMAIFEHLVASGGFYTNRWGDAIVRYAYLTQFHGQTHHFGFQYGHGDLVHLGDTRTTIQQSSIAKFPSPYFFETGTASGSATQLALNLGFEKVFTIDIDPRRYLANLRRFRSEVDSGRLVLLCGDTLDVLSEVLDQVDKPCTFFLDAHHDHGVVGKKRCPLLEELDAIRATGATHHALLIDDRRCFGQTWAWGEHVTEAMVVDKLKQINPNYLMTYEDGYIPQDILCARPPA